MFKSYYEVTFNLAHVSNFPESNDENLDDSDEDEEDGDEDLGDEMLTATIVCLGKLSLPAFIKLLDLHKVKVLSDLGYPDENIVATIISVEDVSENCCITMLPQDNTH